MKVQAVVNLAFDRQLIKKFHGNRARLPDVLMARRGFDG